MPTSTADRANFNAWDFFHSVAHEPVFTPLEKLLLNPFFTNLDRGVFFIHSLPETVIDVLMSMYSRIKNERGLRGLFADTFLPLFLSVNLGETERVYSGNAERFLASEKLLSLDTFTQHSKETESALKDFQKAISVDPEYMRQFASAQKIKRFLSTYLDAYGHNSIARMAKLSLCLENISLLAAKSVEWTRPGSGYIELSARYVDMSGKECYPIAREIGEYGVNPELVQECMDYSFGLYRQFQGENFSGPFPQFLRTRYGNLISDPKDLERGVIGETCDVLGNFLPCATLTSVGVAISGEAFSELLKHLMLDDTPENFVLAKMIAQESEKIGADQFLRHYGPSDWKKALWAYLDPNDFDYGRMGDLRTSRILEPMIVNDEIARRILWASFRKQPLFSTFPSHKFEAALDMLKKIPRGEFDKLPNHFESVSAAFAGVMSFRGWRDLQRQQFCTHYRTYVTPLLGFYHYNKPAPEEFFEACRNAWKKNLTLYETMKAHRVPDALMQYPLFLGNLVGFQIGGNLAQMEFCNWQRTKFSVNHEVRQIFFGIETYLRRAYPWWKEVSRANMMPSYVFARTKSEIPLALK